MKYSTRSAFIAAVVILNFILSANNRGTTATFVCPIDHSSCYKLLHDKTEWLYAKTACEDTSIYPVGAYLYVPSSSEEENMIDGLMSLSSIDEYYIGCEAVNETAFKCFNENEQMDYYNWQNGKPVGKTDHGIVIKGGVWNQKKDKQGVLCELPKPVEVKPIPRTCRSGTYVAYPSTNQCMNMTMGTAALQEIDSLKNVKRCGAASTFVCPIDHSSCYKLLPDKTEWLYAKTACEDTSIYPVGAYLYVPSSSEEEDLIDGLMSLSSIDEYYIGCEAVNETAFKCFNENEQMDYYIPKPVEVNSIPRTCRSGTYVAYPSTNQCMNMGTAALQEIDSLKNVKRCGAACMKDLRCYSFNFIRNSEQDERGRCELFEGEQGFMIAKANSTIVCPIGHSSCYERLLPDGKTWLEAKQACEDLPDESYLFVPSSDEEEALINELYPKDLYIGCKAVSETEFECYHENENFHHNNRKDDKGNADKGLFMKANGDGWEQTTGGKVTLCEFTYSCPDGWTHHSPDSTRCYKLLNDGVEMKWAEAQVACEDPGLPVGSYLFVPSSMDEEMVMQSLYQSSLSDSEMWIGCADLETDTTFTCYKENEVLTYNNWSPGNPDENISTTKQNGATMNIENPISGWVQQKTKLKRSAVCELPATGHAITSYSQNYVIKHDAATGLVLLDRCSSGIPLDEPFSGRSGIRCGAACSLRTGCYSFNFIQPPGQPGEGRLPATGHAITSYSQNYVIKHDTATGLALLDRCSSGIPLDEPFSGRSGIRCGAACSLRTGCYSFNFIQPPGQPGEGRCELIGVDSGAMYYEEGCKYFVKG
eukprot:XP_011661802.1 PREDICTED: uncharacterized protein LOC105437188 [Strongylocentrotus purpuratus]